MSHYHHLTQEQRYHIECCAKRGVTQNEIAQDVGVHRSTISRELKRNKGLRGYRHQQAQSRASDRAQSKHGSRISDYTWALVEHWLRKGFSPEAISGRMKLEGYDAVSYESIYLYIYADKKSGGTLHTYLVSQNHAVRSALPVRMAADRLRIRSVLTCAQRLLTNWRVQEILKWIL